MLEFNLLEYMRTALESLTVILYIRSLENHTSLIQGRFGLLSGGFAPWKGVFILFRRSSFRVRGARWLVQRLRGRAGAR